MQILSNRPKSGIPCAQGRGAGVLAIIMMVIIANAGNGASAQHGQQGDTKPIYHAASRPAEPPSQAYQMSEATMVNTMSAGFWRRACAESVTIRSEPGGRVVGRLGRGAAFFVTASDRRGVWFYGDSVGGLQRGWVLAQYMCSL